jgi:hypothetical protein
MPEIRFDLEQIAEALIEVTLPPAEEARARVTSFGWRHVKHGIAAVALASCLATGLGMRAEHRGSKGTAHSKVERPASTSKGATSIVSAEIARNIRERAKVIGPRLAKLPPSPDDGPDYAWL